VSDRVLAPGFIDLHSHADVSPFVEPGMDSMLRQGVTTVVVGNCGTSAFPPSDLEGVAALAGVGADDLGVTWEAFAEYLDRIDAARPALNVAALVGHGALRFAAMRGDRRRGATHDELRSMIEILEGALEAGAVGMSSGLIYDPGVHGTTDELAALAGAMARRGGLYASHIRGEGPTVFDAVTECIEVGRRNGVPSHVSHLKVEGRSMWGRADELLGLLDRERAGGADVSADQYPYTAWETGLEAALPSWITPSALPEALADASGRRRLVQAIVDGNLDGSLGTELGWDRVMIGSHTPEPTLTGRTIASIAGERGVEPPEAILDLLVADPHTGMVGHGMHEDDVRAILSRPDVMVGTDGIAVSPGGPLGPYAVHPRYYGTFPRILGPYVRDLGLLSLEDAVRKMTALPAERFGLAGRGVIQPGAFADLVVFDPTTVADTATFETPHRFATGIDLVVVNGRPAWGEGSEPGGRALRRNVR
jgi:N-acyl-D-aspartate/D-glutamate deacylase